jgi:Protein of unknown function (DUF3592)
MRSELKSKSDVSIVLVFFAMLAVTGVASGGFFVQDYARARASASWPSVEGIVLSRLDGARERVRYVYSIAGRSYESTREHVLLARFLNSNAPDYLPGETVTVFIDPMDYSYSVLHPGGAGVAFVLFSILSGACIFFGIGGVVWALSQSAGQGFQIAASAL